MSEEKVIELNEVNKDEVKPVSKSVPPNHPGYRIIEAKPVTKLTEEERQIIFESLQAGQPQPNYALRDLKGGGSKIVKAVNKYPNLQVPQKSVDLNIAQNEPVKQSVGKFTNEQMLIQQVMDLNSQMVKMMSKHKKLKKKYKKMKSDIYVDLEDIEKKDQVQIPPEKVEQTIEEPTIEETQQIDNRNNVYMYQLPISKNWRKYL